MSDAALSPGAEPAPLKQRLDAAREGRPQSAPGEEELRFIRNFHDVFLSLGIALFGAGLALVSGLIAAEVVNFDDFDSVKQSGWIVSAIAFANAGVMWLTAEFFARTRRLFLPAIVILIGFTAFVGFGLFVGYVSLFAEGDFNNAEEAIDRLRFMPLSISIGVTLAIFAYYLRMKLPFAMGLGGVALAGTGVAALAAVNHELILSAANMIQLLAGVFLFVLGVAFDARDPERKTRYSDNGFWLHFFAAPLVFNASLSLAAGGSFVRGFSQAAEIGDINVTGPAIITLALVVLFSVISLLINRRALLVAGLLSAAFAIAYLVSQTGLSGAWTAGVTLLTLGFAMVLLGGGWHFVRRILVAPFPKNGFIARIIPPEPAPGGRALTE